MTIITTKLSINTEAVKHTSLWSSCTLWLHWKRNGNKSGHSPAGTAYFAMTLTTFALARLTGELQNHRAVSILWFKKLGSRILIVEKTTTKIPKNSKGRKKQGPISQITLIMEVLSSLSNSSINKTIAFLDGLNLEISNQSN